MDCVRRGHARQLFAVELTEDGKKLRNVVDDSFIKGYPLLRLKPFQVSNVQTTENESSSTSNSRSKIRRMYACLCNLAAFWQATLDVQVDML